MLLGWVHRVRDLGSLVFLDVRDRDGITQVVVARRRRAAGRRQAAAAGVRRRGHRAGASGGRRRRSTRSSQTGEVEVRGARDPAAERGEDAAVPDRRRRAGVAKTCGCSIATSICAAPRLQHNIDAAPPRDDGDPEVLRRAGLPRDRDADPDEVDAGRRARLPRAEPRASRASSTRCRSRRRSSSRS